VTSLVPSGGRRSPVILPPYKLERLGVVMTPDPNDAREAGGVLNPASARRNGEIFLFPRLVADGNVSRIGRARVIFDDAGNPAEVERMGTVLEPEEAWELHAGGGGVEDPRITYVSGLGRWLMTYTAYGPLGPRIGLAVSEDTESWQRLGPVAFAYDPSLGTDLNLYPNKDALLFPEPVMDPDGRLAYAMLHRPMWDLSWVRPGEGEPLPAGLTDPRPGIWISFVSAARVDADLRALARLEQHRLVAMPEYDWEVLKIGGGTPPIRVAEGWLVLYHGVRGALTRGFDLQPAVRYSAGALVLDATEVTRVLARSAQPLLEPELAEERDGAVPNVVFPTAIEPLNNGSPDFHVYYGMADARIGAALLHRTADG